MSYVQLIADDGALFNYRLAETAGVLTADALGILPNATLYNGVVLGEPGALSVGNTAFQFNSVSLQYVGLVNSDNTPVFNVAMSVEFWVKTNGTLPATVFYMRSAGVNPYLAVAINRNYQSNAQVGGVYVEFKDANVAGNRLFGGTGTGLDSGIIDGAWHHVVVTIDAATNTLLIYVDGAVVSTTNNYAETPTNLSTDTIQLLTLGAASGGLHGLSGGLDEVSFNRSVLTPVQVFNHYHTGLTGSSRGQWHANQWLDNQWHESHWIGDFSLNAVIGGVTAYATVGYASMSAGGVVGGVDAVANVGGTLTVQNRIENVDVPLGAVGTAVINFNTHLVQNYFVITYANVGYANISAGGIVGGVSGGTPTIGGGFIMAGSINGGVTAVANVSGTLTVPTTTISGGVTAVANVGGAAVMMPVTGSIFGGVTSIANVGYTAILLQAVLNTGVTAYAVVSGSLVHIRLRSDITRPTLPIIVYAIEVNVYADVVAANVPDGKHYLFTVIRPTPGNEILADSAQPGDIAKYDASGTDLFSRPRKDEVVWYVKIDANGNRADQGMKRWDGNVWLDYATLPERAVQGQRVFDMLDPDRIYQYYGRLLGASYFQWSQDAVDLQDLTSPDECPERFLGLLSKQLGVSIDQNDDIVLKRKRTRDAVFTHHRRGYPELAEIRLQQMGFKGYIREVWVNPTSSGNWTEKVSTPGDVIYQLFFSGVELKYDSGEKGTDWIEVIHGSRNVEPTTYWPSSRVTVHVNNRTGSPLSMAMSKVDALVLNQSIAKELHESVLPAHVDIREFVTDDTIADAQDTVRLTDTLTLTDV